MEEYLSGLLAGDRRCLARCISLAENNAAELQPLLEKLPPGTHTHIVGITGPPGGGKSTLADALIEYWLQQNKQVAVLAVDPSSPFHGGALLGDRVRMSRHYTHPGVFIRSLATRGSLGGLHPQISEISDLVRAAGFDYLVIETVGVGQSEVEIAGLADTTVVVMVPEGGDEIQTMKAGVMEIADIFVVNKSDRPLADEFARHLRMLAHSRQHGIWEIPVIKTVATQEAGAAELADRITEHRQKEASKADRKADLLAEKAFQLIQAQRMRSVQREQLQKEIKKLLEGGTFNLYRFVRNFEA
jgi:LAO/AO transport system kinase